MSDKASIIINSSKNGNDKSMSVGYVNPNATPSELIQFAQGINSLTQNVYRGTTLVEKTELVVKPENPIVLDISTISASVIKSADDQAEFYVLFLTSASDTSYADIPIDKLPQIVSNSTIFHARVLKIARPDGTSVTGVFISNDSRIIAGGTIDAVDTVFDSSGVELTADPRETGEIVVQLPETTQYAAKTFTITVTA